MEAYIAPECEWHPSEKKIPPEKVAKLIDKIERGLGVPMERDASGYMKVRFSDYRAVFKVDPDDPDLAHIVYIAHRDDQTYGQIADRLKQADPTR